MSTSKLQVIAPSLTALLVFACGGDPKPESKAPAKTAEKPVEGEHAADAAPALAEPVKQVDGPAPSGDDRFALSVEPVEATVGNPASIAVRVVPKAPWHMNLDFPTSLQVTPVDTVEVAKADLKKADAKRLDAEGCEFDVGFTPKAAGEQTFTGKFKFAVCQDEACAPVTRDVEFKVAVK